MRYVPWTRWNSLNRCHSFEDTPIKGPQILFFTPIIAVYYCLLMDRPEAIYRAPRAIETPASSRWAARIFDICKRVPISIPEGCKFFLIFFFSALYWELMHILRSTSPFKWKHGVYLNTEWQQSDKNWWQYVMEHGKFRYGIH